MHLNYKDPRDFVCPQKAAVDVLADAFQLVGNHDLEARVPALLSCIAHPSEAASCIDQLSNITFAHRVQAPILALLIPVLIQGLREENSEVLDKTAHVIASMAKVCPMNCV